MNVKETLKKNWFVVVISAFLIAGLVFLAIDSSKSKVTAKQTADGKDVVFSYDGKDYTADDLYDEVFETLDIGVIVPVLELEIYRDAMEVTDAMISDVENLQKQILTSLKTTYGEQWEEALQTLLIQSGYVVKTGEDGLKDYLTITEVRTQVERAYLLEHKELYESYMKENEPRLVSHILVKMADSENPTEEETKKMNDIKELLAADNANFADIATLHSDDGSKEQGGSLGLVTLESNKKFVQEFQDQVYTVGAGEMTEWFQTEYGYHIIRVDATDIEGFTKLNNYDVFTNIFKESPEILLDITWEQVTKRKITFGDNEELNKAITEHYTKEEEK